MSAKKLLRNYRMYKESYHSLMGQILREDGVLNKQYPSGTQKINDEMTDFNTNKIISTTESYAIKNVEIDNKINRLYELNRVLNAIDGAVNSLHGKEKEIIKWKYFDGRELNKVTLFNRQGEIMSEKGVYFLHDKAIQKLNIALKYIKIIE